MTWSRGQRVLEIGGWENHPQSIRLRLKKYTNFEGSLYVRGVTRYQKIATRYFLSLPLMIFPIAYANMKNENEENSS